jgi:alkanesulfonate monooxygenase SsuD/methylene tetrahydromethanopterin reductase-like flavin-dependent oxidoreductase (luciferase family)
MSSAGRYGVAFWSGETHDHLVTLARRAEHLGFDSFWLAEYYHYYALGPLAAVIATATERIQIGLGVLPTHTRHPGLIAMEAAALDAISEGRLLLGLGAGQTAANRHGRTAAPVKMMREALPILRGLLGGGEVSAAGEVWSINESRMSVPVRNMPIYVGTFPYSPRMLRTAAELADGVALVWTTPDWVRRARDEVASAAAQAGRDPASVEIGAYVVISVDEDGAKARRACRRVIAGYAVRTARWIDAGLVSAEDLEPVVTAYQRGGLPAAIEAVDDHLVEKLAIAGEPAYCRDRLAEYRDDARLDFTVAYQVMGPDQLEGMSLLATEVFRLGASGDGVAAAS